MKVRFVLGDQYGIEERETLPDKGHSVVWQGQEYRVDKVLHLKDDKSDVEITLRQPPQAGIFLRKRHR